MKQKLPCPRFELRWKKDKNRKDWKIRKCTYSLVIPLGEYDIRREGKNYAKVRDSISLKIGSTKVSGGNGNPPICDDGNVDTPFRDWSHALWDNKALGGNIPIVSICEDVFTVLEPK